jgi:DNA-binding SARP family transcriptional activator/TolB-like protein
MIAIKLFGNLTIVGPDGVSLPVAGSKTQGLVAYLALNTELPPSRDRLMALFWGDRFTDQARQSLRQAIAKLRRTLSVAGEDILLTEGDRVRFNPSKVVVDADEFAQLAKDMSAEATERAVSLLAGPLLDGIYGQQAEFDDWVASERQRLGSLSLKVLERAAEHRLKQGETNAATDLARRIVGIDPLRDAGQMVLIRILAQQGERSAAIQQFKTYETTLRKELGVGAGPELLRLIEEVRGENFFAKPALPDALAAPSGGSPDPAGKSSILVVPFKTFDGGPTEAFLADGLSQDITTNLSRFSWLDVRASFEGEDPFNTSDAMSELRTDYVVQGSLRSHGEQIRLTVQLSETLSRRYVWVSRNDRVTDDLFALQDELSETIAASIEAELERLVGRSSRTLAFQEMNAWECYHRGLAIQYEFNADTNIEAQRYFQRAIDLDPNFGLAHARLSYALVISAIYFEADDVPALLDRALALAQTAARLEPNDAVARFALGRVHLARGEYDRSIADLKAAIDLNPGMAQAYCGLGDSMAYSGRLDDAIDCFEEAVRISPADPYRWAFLSYGATAFLFKGDYGSAAKWSAEAESIPNSHYWPTAILASALAHMGEMEKAGKAVSHLKTLRPGIDIAFVRSRLFYLKDPDQVEIYLSGLRKAGLE